MVRSEFDAICERQREHVSADEQAELRTLLFSQELTGVLSPGKCPLVPAEDRLPKAPPLAQEVKPQVVAVWLGIDDLAQHTPIDQFASELRDLIDELRATGAQRILVADLPRVFGAGALSYNTERKSVV